MNKICVEFTGIIKNQDEHERYMYEFTEQELIDLVRRLICEKTSENIVGCYCTQIYVKTNVECY